MFKRGDLVRHKIGNETWFVEKVEEQKCWPWSKPETIVTVLRSVPRGDAFDYGCLGHFTPEELVAA